MSVTFQAGVGLYRFHTYSTYIVITNAVRASAGCNTHPLCWLLADLFIISRGPLRLMCHQIGGTNKYGIYWFRTNTSQSFTTSGNVRGYFHGLSVGGEIFVWDELSEMRSMTGQTSRTDIYPGKKPSRRYYPRGDELFDNPLVHYMWPLNGAACVCGGGGVFCSFSFCWRRVSVIVFAS